MKNLFNRKSLKGRRRELRNNGTYAEAILWKALQNRKLAGKKFRRQHSIGPYIADLYCPECRVIVELDGAVHNQMLRGEYDAERSKYFQRFGIRVLRFENRLVRENPEAVLEAISQALLT